METMIELQKADEEDGQEHGETDIGETTGGEVQYTFINPYEYGPPIAG